MRLVLAVLISLFGISIVNAQTSIKLCYPTAANADNCVIATPDTPFPVTGTFTPGGTQNVNISQILGAAPSLTNPLWITSATGAVFPSSQSGTWTVQPGNTANSTPWLVTATGNVASGATDSGNPIKVGGVYNTTTPTFTNGQRGDLQVGTRGSLNVTLYISDSTNPIAAAATTTDGVATSGTANKLQTASLLYNFNGSTFDRAFTCPSSATISVTAGATTEIVALTASQVIRVCSFVITESLAGTATFVYGTGTNCAGSPVSLTGVMQLVTGGSIALSGVNGSLFRTASANALCLTAVTGNITGFVTYAKY